jgi:ATP-dependent helicase HrpB
LEFDYRSFDLPIKDVIPEIKEELVKSNTLIVKAPPGAGKSTLIPLAFLNEKWLGEKKILMLEPRRLAAKSIASRLADLLGEKLGETVGYRIRFESKIGPNTKIEVLTEGILTRMLQQDNSLENVGMVIFDEFHERSIHADLALALSRESQQVLRPDLRLLVMSATLDTPELTQALEAKLIESEGRQYPVNINYAGEADWKLLPELCSRLIKKVLEGHSRGDILVFLPGQGEIKKCEQLLRSSATGVHIRPLYGQLPFKEQRAAILPDKNGTRKVVLATNIAETSLTIEGISIVIDSGFERKAQFNPNSGLTRLETQRISKDSADQRAGRAGRLGPGTCYRMWTLGIHSKMKTHAAPEIENADLAPLALDLAQWGIQDANSLIWVTPPPLGNLSKAVDLLHELGALENKRITAHGKELQKLPTHPRIAHMLIAAKQLDQLSLACDIAALLEERDPLPKEAGIDINLRIEALRRYRKDNGGPNRLQQIEKIAQQYRSMFNVKCDNGLFDEHDTGLLIAHTYPERIACARPGNNAQFQMANGKFAAAGHKDDLAHAPWLAIANVADRQGSGKIFLASPLNPKDLLPMVKTKKTISWNTKKGGLLASEDLRIGNIVLKSTPLDAPDKDEIIKVICHAIEKEGQSLLNWDDNVEQWQNRIISLRTWNQNESWPDVSTENLLKTNEDWLSPYITEVNSPEDLKKINLFEILRYSLPLEKQEILEKLAPRKIKVPSGSEIKLTYQSNGSDPVLAVRLQECFGMTATPKVNNGKQNVLMHLLSPGFKIVQITSDLKSFWNEGYHEVRKDLRMRYKKHFWPENPWEVEAIKGSRKRK